MTGPVQLPRELVLASAGTGKTFRISSRIIGLLAAKVPVESIFASTFTRKAAGEILDRVLARLADAALDAEHARKLAEFVKLDRNHQVSESPAEWLRLLQDLVRQLHRVNIGTLDAFFVRTALSFGDEIGLPPVWSIADIATLEHIRSEALQEVFTHSDRRLVTDLVRGITRYDAGRSVHDALLRSSEDLLEVHHALDQSTPGAWRSLDEAAGEPPRDFQERQRQLASELRTVVPPSTRAGTPNVTWAKALQRCADHIQAGDWEALIRDNLCVAARAEARFFSSQEIPSHVCSIFSAACQLARFALGRRLARQSRALGQLSEILAGAVQSKQRELGAFGFGDITRLIGGPDPLCDRGDLYYRLDARTEHILLDEFQDTSLSQWEAMEPLLDELLSGYAGERAAIVVADPKQSIYAWRGGEPLLVRHVGDKYELNQEGLHTSYRSSQVVLDAVNEIFEELTSNPVFGDDPVARDVAAEWSRDFRDHKAAKVLPGYVRIVVGPADEGRGSDRPNLCRRTAQLVAELRESAPGCSIGVLTRRNRTVAQIMLELRQLNVPASEEGGNPLTDSAAVASILALLRLAEHPGDTIVRYHVAMTPVGRVVGLPPAAEPRKVQQVADDVRRRLLIHGYGRTIERFARKLEPAASVRERRRMAQLVELAFRFDGQATLRIADFLNLVDQERVEDPTTADVRVMTVHQSKGLEFDIVVLPELDSDLAGREPNLLAYRPHPAGRITHAFPYVSETVRDLFPEVPELRMAAEQARAGRLRDGLSSLYVGLTRARYALHLVLKPDGKSGMGTRMSGARLLRHSLGAIEPATEGRVLFQRGTADWYDQLRNDVEPASGVAQLLNDSPRVSAAVALRDSSRSRSFARRTPSALAGGSEVDLRMMMSLDTRATSEGTIIHAWLERLEWVEDGLPEDSELLFVARRLNRDISEGRVTELIHRVRGWLAVPAIGQALSRFSYPDLPRLEREAPFVYRENGVLVEGVIDRLVLHRQNGRVTHADILDYKTDSLTAADRAAIEEREVYYRPQVDSYRKATARGFRIPEADVRCYLVFLNAGEVREV
ncbi:UvrD-helicase domain-containing protein [soil metagenome]